MRRTELRLPQGRAAVDGLLARWRREEVGRRLRAKDWTLWSTRPLPELADRLGWLDLPDADPADVEELRRFGDAVRAEGVRHVALLGMGGSSLAPEVLQRTFGARPGWPALSVLDSTHPDAVAAAAAALDLDRTLFVVSSKSGGTLETLSLLRFFFARAAARDADPGRRFVAITDPGSSLEALAAERGFREIFLAPPEVGGRYSALSVFGLLPGALIGVDPGALLAAARTEAAAEPDDDAGLELAACLAVLAAAGRDKLTFVASPSLVGLPDWIEQLVAESTGKEGRGLVPVAGEPLGPPAVYGADRVFVRLLLEGEDDPAVDAALASLHGDGHPVLTMRLAGPAELGAVFLRWEVATAVIGRELGIQPFDQPDVQLAKDLARRAMAAAPGTTTAAAAPAHEAPTTWLEQALPGDYLAIQAFLAPSPQIQQRLAALQAALRNRLRVAVTVGFGPRFLHSTGQLHKGGPASGMFLQLVDRPAAELAVPETDFGFGRLVAAQARGDLEALAERGRRRLRLDLGDRPLEALDELLAALAR